MAHLRIRWRTDRDTTERQAPRLAPSGDALKVNYERRQ